MQSFQKKQKLLRCFSELLTYPEVKPQAICDQILPLAQEIAPQAMDFLSKFTVWAKESTLNRMQEVFTSTFDVQVVCYPYIGYQLFGESYKRGTFMVKLIEFYKNENFSVEKELPDHLAVVLKFMSITKDETLFGNLLNECLIPSLDKMKVVFEKRENPYASVLEALFTTLHGMLERINVAVQSV